MLQAACDYVSQKFSSYFFRVSQKDEESPAIKESRERFFGEQSQAISESIARPVKAQIIPSSQQKRVLRLLLGTMIVGLVTWQKETAELSDGSSPLSSPNNGPFSILQWGLVYACLHQVQGNRLGTLTAFLGYLAQKVEANAPPFFSTMLQNYSITVGETLTIPNLQDNITDPDGDPIEVEILSSYPFLDVRHLTLRSSFPAWVEVRKFQIEGEIGYFFSGASNWGILGRNLTDPDTLPIAIYATPTRALSGQIINGNNALYQGYLHVYLSDIFWAPPNFNPADGYAWGPLASIQLPIESSSANPLMVIDPVRPIIWLIRNTEIYPLSDAFTLSSPHTIEVEATRASCEQDTLLYLVLGNHGPGLNVLDTSNPNAIVDLGRVISSRNIYDYTIRDNIFYGGTSGGLCLYDATNRTDIISLNTCFEAGTIPEVVRISGDKVFVGRREGGWRYVNMYQMRSPANLTFMDTLELGYGDPQVPIYDMAIKGKRIYIAAGAAGVFLVDFDTVGLTIAPEENDEGSYPITVRAKDTSNGTVSETFWITILPAPSATLVTEETSIGSSSAPIRIGSNPSPSPLLPILLGSGALIVLGFGIGTIVVCALYRKKRREPRIHDLELYSPQPSIPMHHENIRGIFGAPTAYGWFDDMRKETRNLLEQSGFIFDEQKHKDGVIGKGAFGTIQICWSFDQNKYCVVKSVEGEKKIEESEGEALLQNKAAGPGIVKILHTIPDPKKEAVYHILELAGYGSLGDFRKRISERGAENHLELFARIVAHDTIRGLLSMYKAGIVHNDLKGENVLVFKEGKIEITDFGKAREAPDDQISGDLITDFWYLSPERLLAQYYGTTFRGKINDAWALGCTLLSFLKGRHIKEILGTPNSRNFTTKEYLDEYIQRIPSQLDKVFSGKSMQEESIWSLLYRLLQIDPRKRLTIEQASHHGSLKDLPMKREELFAALCQVSGDDHEEKETTYSAIPAYDHEREQTDYVPIGYQVP